MGRAADMVGDNMQVRMVAALRRPSAPPYHCLQAQQFHKVHGVAFWRMRDCGEEQQRKLYYGDVSRKCKPAPTICGPGEPGAGSHPEAAAVYLHTPEHCLLIHVELEIVCSVHA
ncbi:hypothetical protein E2C01_082943 [Portunus trituberculatus]|uniref:Uncharacterized protein n=1 Tax=Portunus trituberculatus TaxID=210409 RepID=A0A5B7J6G3_PORTR|nr:hypothetical protein [Portunus trituberculatus]